ncbi:hypothetical protein MP228_000595 [Amoeboaphelidium protococcarum]|nr:hypothetical protein MP228_000595 [Amoeboaphelidium protococcarum]
MHGDSNKGGLPEKNEHLPDSLNGQKLNVKMEDQDSVENMYIAQSEALQVRSKLTHSQSEADYSAPTIFQHGAVVNNQFSGVKLAMLDTSQSVPNSPANYLRSSFDNAALSPLQQQQHGAFALSPISSSFNASGGGVLDFASLLKQNSLFASISRDGNDSAAQQQFIDSIAAKMRIRNYQVGDVIIREGDIGKALFLVARGVVTVLSKDNEMVYADLGPGTFVGEIGVLFDIPRTANVVAKSRCMLAVLTQQEFLQIVNKYTEFADDLRFEAERRYNSLMQQKKIKTSLFDSLNKATLSCDAGEQHQVPLDWIQDVLVNTAELHTLSKGDCVYTQDQALDKDYCLYVVKSGQVCLMRHERDHIYLNMTDGCFFGEENAVIQVGIASIVEKESYYSTALVLSDSLTCYKLSAVEVKQIQAKHPELREKLCNAYERVKHWDELINRPSSDLNPMVRKKSFLALSRMHLDGAVSPGVSLGASSDYLQMNQQQSPGEMKLMTQNTSLTPGRYPQGLQEAAAQHSRSMSAESQQLSTMQRAFEQHLSAEMRRASTASSFSSSQSSAAVAGLFTARLNESTIGFGGAGSFANSISSSRRFSELGDIIPRQATPQVELKSVLISPQSASSQSPRSQSLSSIKQGSANVSQSPLGSSKSLISRDINQSPGQSAESLKQGDRNDRSGTRNALSLEQVVADNEEEIDYQAQSSSDLSSEYSDEMMDDFEQGNDQQRQAQASSKKNYASRMSHLVASDPTRRRASIAVWTDQKMATMAQQKTVQTLPQTPVSILPSRKMASVLSPAYTADNDNASSAGSSLQSLDDDGGDTDNLSSNHQILTEVFRWLSFKQRWNLRIVTKKWKSIIQTSYNLINTVDLQDFAKSIDDAALETILSSVGPSVETLIIKNCWKITNNGMKIIGQYCKQLQVLDMCGCWEVTDDGLMAMSIGCKFLKGIDLSSCRKITDAGIFSLLNNCTSMHDLYLSYCKALTDNILVYLSQMSPNIRRINLQRCLGITDQGFTLFSGIETNLMVYQKLQELLLNDCSFLSDSALEDISFSCPNLKILNVSFCCALTDVSWAYLTERCKRMRILDASFCGNAVTDEALLLMATSWNELQALSIRGCAKVTDDGVRHLAHHAHNLKKLNVSACKGVSSDNFVDIAVPWKFLSAQISVIDSAGIGGTSPEAFGSSHIRRFTAP